MQAQDILNFWFNPEHRSLWFAKSDEFDAKIRDQFQIIHHQAIQAELWSWRHTPEGRLAKSLCWINFLATYIVIKRKLLPMTTWH